MPTNENAATILIVDDTPENLHMLNRILQNRGYRVKASPSGEHALKAAANQPPDLILLDVNMPKMNGFEVCRVLKQNQELKDIPVLFISALSDIKSKVEAFQAGGIDYITKPFQIAEVEARVRTHLELRSLQKSLEEQNVALQEAASLREDVERITRHDLKTPLGAILAYAQFLQLDDNLMDRQKQDIQKIFENGHAMLQMINASFDLFKMERGLYQLMPSHFNLLKILEDVTDSVNHRMESKNLSTRILVDNETPEQGQTVDAFGEELLIFNMLANLLKNAVDASPSGESITVSVLRNDSLDVHISNKGCVPEGIRATFFEKYVTSGKTQGIGLGTYSSKLIANTHGGTIAMTCSEESGTTIHVSLPRAPQ